MNWDLSPLPSQVDLVRVSAASLATTQEDESTLTYGGIPSVVSVHGVRVLQLGSALPLQKPRVCVFHCHTIFLREQKQ